MPQELFPTAIIKAMIPYADIGTAHSLELLLQTEQMHSMVEQTIESFQKFQEVLTIQSTQTSTESDYELTANELGNGTQSDRHAGQEMDLEGMIQAVQAVCGTEERRRLNQILMLVRVRKVLSASHDSSLMFEAVSSMLSPEQKKQMDEILPLLSMIQEGKMV